MASATTECGWRSDRGRRPAFADAKLAINDFGFNQGWRTDVHEPAQLGDLTGDGKADLIAFGNDGVWTALNCGDGSFAPAQLVVGNLGANQGWRTSQHPRFVADLRVIGTPT